MTAIPAATEEDFAGIRNIEEVYAETEEILKGYGLMDCNDKIAIESVLELAYLRIIAHFQRENERLARQRDEVLRVMTLEQVEALAGAAYDRTDPIALAFFLSEKQRRMEEPQCQLPRL